MIKKKKFQVVTKASATGSDLDGREQPTDRRNQLDQRCQQVLRLT